MSIEFIKYNWEPGFKSGTEKTILELCEKVQAQARALAPVDKGILRNSIGYVTNIAKDGDLEISPKENEGFVGSVVEYAVYQEFGTRTMPAQPYLRPAADVVRGESAESVIKKQYDQNIKKAVQSGKKKEKF